MAAKKWQQDKEFVAWLLDNDGVPYARLDKKGKVESYLTEAGTIYMWEAFKAGKKCQSK